MVISDLRLDRVRPPGGGGGGHFNFICTGGVATGLEN